MERRWGPRARSFARMFVIVASLGTFAMAAWLGGVILWVLPAHDPERIPLWSKVATAFLLYAVLSLGALARHERLAWIDSIARIASVAACGAGTLLVASMVQAPQGGFEGYLLVMGSWILFHGIALLAHLAIQTGVERIDRT
jgi:hypothetical protein